MSTETRVPRKAVIIIVGATVLWCIASLLHLPSWGAPAMDFVRWFFRTALFAIIVFFGMTWMVVDFYNA